MVEDAQMSDTNDTPLPRGATEQPYSVDTPKPAPAVRALPAGPTYVPR